ncbi:MAG: DMT family transporter [Gemmatimonadales bacterium]
MVQLCLVMVQVFFASLAVIGRLVLPVVPAGALVTIRILGAAAALGLFNAARGGPWIHDRRDLLRVALSGWLGVTANQSLYLFGLAHSTAVNATILVTTAPVFTVLGSLVLGLERPSSGKLGGIALAAVGAVYLIDPTRLTFAPGVALGNLLILLGMACYAAYFLVSKPLLARYDAITVGTYVMLFAALGVLPFGLPALWALTPGVLHGSMGWLVAYIVVGPTIGAYFLNLWALKRVSSNTVASFLYLQPLFAAVSAPLILPGERLTGRTLGAGCLIFLGLGLVLWAERMQRRGVSMDGLSTE